MKKIGALCTEFVCPTKISRRICLYNTKQRLFWNRSQLDICESEMLCWHCADCGRKWYRQCERMIAKQKHWIHVMTKSLNIVPYKGYKVPITTLTTIAFCMLNKLRTVFDLNFIWKEGRFCQLFSLRSKKLWKNDKIHNLEKCKSWWIKNVQSRNALSGFTQPNLYFEMSLWLRIIQFQAIYIGS